MNYKIGTILNRRSEKYYEVLIDFKDGYIYTETNEDNFSEQFLPSHWILITDIFI